MTPRLGIGDRVPDVTLAQLRQDAVIPVPLTSWLASRRVALAGIPGAFTPVCSCRHIPDLLDNVARLKAAGFDEVAVVAPDNPWVVSAWAQDVDPLGRLTFLSDGNLALARALGVAVHALELMLGETSTRYLLIAKNGLIQRFNVEGHLNDLGCTRASDAVYID